MGNCLYTQLKGVVSNDNLPVYGELKVKATTTGTASISFESNKAQNVKVLAPNGSVIQTISVSANTRLNLTQDASSYDYVVFAIPDKFAVTRLSCLATSPASSDAAYESVNSPNYMNNVGVFGNCYYDWGNEYVSMDALTNINEGDVSDITNFSSCLSITVFQRGTSARGKVGGDLQKFISDMCKNGRTSGTMAVQIQNFTTLKWGSTSISSFKVTATFSETGCTVTKDSGTMPFTSTTYTKSSDTWA